MIKKGADTKKNHSAALCEAVHHAKTSHAVSHLRGTGADPNDTRPPALAIAAERAIDEPVR